MSDSTPHDLSALALEAFLHAKIPLTHAMGVRVVLSSRERLIVEAPLAPNVNHLGTAFGGSLHTLATVACYATVWLLLREAGFDGHVVLKRSSAEYRLPVEGMLRAECPRPADEIVRKFFAALTRHQKARMELSARVEGPADRPAVEYHGVFVAVL